MSNYEFEMFIAEVEIGNAEIIDWDGSPIQLIDVLKQFDDWAAKRRAEEQSRENTKLSYPDDPEIYERATKESPVRIEQLMFESGAYWMRMKTIGK